ncbi:MAG TPA: 50S ribosomal protein L10 [Acidimicrobiales bacterium]|nr:50S ribosomal protein L10 [Acidimicrobiales bacterium]
MDNPRPEKTAIVTEVRQRLDAAEAAILTEYRGLTVAELAALRHALQAAGGDYKIYKNTLVKLAVSGGDHESLAPLLVGPTAIAFVSGEVSAAAKALRDFARTYPSLVVKGGFHSEGFLTSQELAALADLPSRDVLLARVAGAIAAPLQQLAGLFQALPRNLAYGLSALLDQQGGAPVVADAPAEEAPGGEEPAAVADAAPQAEAASTETADAAPQAEAASTETADAAPAQEPQAEQTDAGSPDEG